ncbi:hypothetical protein CARUB_v10015658mg [Capsella rubella]|uniref:GRF-type domain-containing protein n=1 Tax=Capsella rubella TaxID=81985 RepID=R0I7F5_9BRAS|nr:hypothetical protein CARUB_v10015658mg [Capsella rubella]
MSSSSETSMVDSFDRGVPSKCVCGAGVTIFTSRTQENPGRPFFRCLTKRDAKSWTNKRDGHMFKWVEDAVYEEVQDALPKVGAMANEIVKTKSEVIALNAQKRTCDEFSTKHNIDEFSTKQNIDEFRQKQKKPS